MARSHTFFFLISTLALAGVFTMACDSGTQEPEATPTDATIPLESDAADEMQAELDPATDDTGDSEIPDAFPEEVPIYPGSTTTQGKGAVLNGTPMAAVQLQTSDSPAEVYEYYLEKFGRDGWTIDPDKNLKGKNSVSATNGKCTATMLAAPSEDGGADVFIVTEC